jgi:hypothetical protein
MTPTITEVAGLLVLEWNGAGESVDITREALEELVELVNEARTRGES